jgi:hypothetical protein
MRRWARCDVVVVVSIPLEIKLEATPFAANGIGPKRDETLEMEAGNGWSDVRFIRRRSPSAAAICRGRG